MMIRDNTASDELTKRRLMLKSLQAVTNSETWSVGVLARGIGAAIVAKMGNPDNGSDDLAAGYGIEADCVIGPDK